MADQEVLNEEGEPVSEVDKEIRLHTLVLKSHNCWESPVPYVSDHGALRHGFECSTCGAFLQVG